MRDAHQPFQWHPTLAGHNRWTTRPGTQRPEGRRTRNGPSGSPASQRGLAVFQHQAAVGQRQERGWKLPSASRHFDILIARERLGHQPDLGGRTPAGIPAAHLGTGPFLTGGKSAAANRPGCLYLGRVTCGRGGFTVSGHLQLPSVAELHLRGIRLARIEVERGALGVERQLVESWTRVRAGRSRM